MYNTILRKLFLLVLIATILGPTLTYSRKRRPYSSSSPHTETLRPSAIEQGSLRLSAEPKSSALNLSYLCNVSCENGKIAYLKKGKVWKCYCIENSFHDCLAQYRMSGENECKPIFIAITSSQCVILFGAISLNLAIVWNFFKTPKIRTKIPNILLLNQAVVDVASCLVYSIPNIVHVIYQILYEEIIRGFTAVSVSLLTLTASSSICLYIIITIDRFLSIYWPFQHIAKIHSRHLWTATSLQWLLSIVLTTISLIGMFTRGVKARWRFLRSYRYVLVVALLILVVLISVSMIACFFKALYSIRMQHQRRSENIQNRKRFKLMSVFLVMYLVFLATFTPIAVSALIGSRMYNALNQTIITLFTFSSVLNASLTMYFRREFRPCKYSAQVRVPRTINVNTAL